jgi:hypothetical protein
MQIYYENSALEHGTNYFMAVNYTCKDFYVINHWNVVPNYLFRLV